MSTIEASGQHRRTGPFPWASVIWSLTAAGLLLSSAVLQHIAAIQRWVVFNGSRGPTELSVEDHLFDYNFPTDAWVPVGTAAQVYGTGTLIQALGVLAMAFGVLALPGAASRRRVVFAIMEIVIALLVAAWLGLNGAHALVSGIIGTPSPLQHWWALDWIGVAGLVALGVLWWRRSWAAMIACAFLLGSSLMGYYFVASLMITPLITGYISHDTTPWTETVVATWTALAGVAMLLAAWAATRGGVRPDCPAQTASVLQ